MPGLGLSERRVDEPRGEGSTVGRGGCAGTLVRSRLLEAKAQSPIHLTRNPDHVASACIYKDTWLLSIKRVYLYIEFYCAHNELNCALKSCCHV